MANTKDQIFRLGTRVHEAVFRFTKGRLLGRAGGMPVVMLTTTGRRSNKSRTTMLTSPVQEDGRLILVASYGGDDRHPAWYKNLQAHPQVELTMRGHTRSMQARTASPEEKSELWPRVTAAYKGYAGYQRRTEREIPLVILEPR
ncbi:MAG: nitroreductase family deazaflavin-dependent oxidoreductase [Acidimicrobiales bacterium]